jgi:hypothetical protein
VSKNTITITRGLPFDGTLRVADRYLADLDGERREGIVCDLIIERKQAKITLELS